MESSESSKLQVLDTLCSSNMNIAINSPCRLMDMCKICTAPLLHVDSSGLQCFSKRLYELLIYDFFWCVRSYSKLSRSLNDLGQ